jgi:hypothetical protein
MPIPTGAPRGAFGIASFSRSSTWDVQQVNPLCQTKSCQIPSPALRNCVEAGDYITGEELLLDCQPPCRAVRMMEFAIYAEMYRSGGELARRPKIKGLK